MDQIEFHREDLAGLALEMLVSGGLERAKAETVAELLIQTDEIGVTTHGISMLPYYLPELKSGNMKADGDYAILRDNRMTMVWDGEYLPGHWLMSQALETCMGRAREYGMAALAMRRAHHIGCLSTLTRIAADKGLICYIATSDPSGQWVAPFGGSEPLLTPNPWAVGYPTHEHPVLIDTCASVTTVSKVRAHINSGTRFAHPWMLDAEGRATTDPNVVNADPPGSLLPVGGLDHGHKGFAMALMVEMQTQALSGHGRAQGPQRWGGNVFVNIIDPEAFAGRDAFLDEVSFVNDRCRANRPVAGGPAVRVPGDRAFAALEAARPGQVRLPREVWSRVSACAAEQGVALPRQAGP